ncbi:MAG: sigma 54-interacting transcriptional regulator [Myxococcales bacterium]|nr:sigma 54-interacting transcriptional regulator [Myxococcales bacterium]
MEPRVRHPDLSPTTFHGMVTVAPQMLRLFELIRRAGRSDATVLVRGESGTGKELVASALHACSPRSGHAFQAVNCATFTSELLASELFGHVRGAFTGAIRDRKGLLSLAHRGTLFLDEVAELPVPLQAKLLQILQERTYHRVGDPRSRPADVRVVAATNVDLDEATKSGRFREDLRFRLEVVPLRVPSLEHRRVDIRPLAESFLVAAAARHPGLRARELSPNAAAALVHAEWPGNVRQLRNTLEAGMVRAHARGHERIEVSDLFHDHPGTPDATWQDATRQFQRRLLEATLIEEGWSVPAAAKRLDLARSRAYELVRAMGLVAPTVR